MKRLQSLSNDKVVLEVGECDCGYHFGVDATFLDQVGGFTFNCPSCNEVIDTGKVFSEFVMCKFCKSRVSVNVAHLHDFGWVCKECWDERLRSTE